MADLSQIQTFVEVARTGSFAEASRRLSLSRSTVSARIRALEDRLGVRLLQRTTRRVALTHEGRAYLARCEDAMATLLEAESALSGGNMLAGLIRMTVPIDIAQDALVASLAAFCERYPKVQLDVLVSDEPADLIAENIDLALRGGAPGAAGLVARKLGEGRMAYVASPALVADKDRARWFDQTDAPVLLDPLGRAAPELKQKCLPARLHTRNHTLARMIARQGKAVALLPLSICREELDSGLLVHLPAPDMSPNLLLYMVLPTRHHVPARVRALVDHLVAYQRATDGLVG